MSKTMTVAQLIARLKELPQNLQVFYEDGKWSDRSFSVGVSRADITYVWHDQKEQEAVILE